MQGLIPARLCLKRLWRRLGSRAPRPAWSKGINGQCGSGQEEEDVSGACCTAGLQGPFLQQLARAKCQPACTCRHP